MKRNKGFTLIELLVVIAIIGILSAIVLASLNSARNKAQDAKVQSQLANMRAAAEIYYSNHSNAYGVSTGSASCTSDLFDDTTSGMKGLTSSTASPICGATDSEWAAAAPLISTPAIFWCVDSTGASRQVAQFTAFTQTAPKCPVN